MDIGGNDILVCVGANGPAGPDSPGATSVRAKIAGNIAAMLAAFHADAPGVPVIGMTYFNPLLGNWLGEGAPRALALATMPGLLRLNGMLTSAYGGPRLTADVQGAFHATDLTTIVPSRWGNIPIAVERACTLLDIGCFVGRAENFGDDPNEQGAKVIASAFDRTIDRLCARGGRVRLQGCRG